MPEIGLGMNYCEALEKLIVHSNSVLAHLRMIGSVMFCVCEKKGRNFVWWEIKSLMCTV